MEGTAPSGEDGGRAPGDSLFAGVLSLACGAALLLLFPLSLWLPGFVSWTLIYLLLILAYPVLGLNMMGWVLVSRSHSLGEFRTRFLPWSLVAFAIGLTTIPLIAPGWFSGAGAWQFLALGMFAYLPSVLGPVAFAHATFFFAARRSVRNRTASVLFLVGTTALVVISALGVALQIMLMFSSALPEEFFAMNGLTALGYALIAWGVRLEVGESTYLSHRSGG